MREKIFDIILCPVCKGSDFELRHKTADDLEIRKGELLCKKCQAIFSVKQGIIFLYQRLSQSALKEQVALQKEINKSQNLLAFQDEDWLLSFPFNGQLGTDERTARMVKLSSQNALMFLSYFSWPKGIKILELGAGNCWLTARLAKDYQCVGLDILTTFPKGLEAVDVFIKRGGVFFERVVADMEDLPFKDSSFDIVLVNSALHHSPDLERTLEEVHRVLTPAGKLILLNEPSIGWFGGRERKEIRQDWKRGISENRYTIRQWTRTFKKAGFKYKIYLPPNLLEILRTKNTTFKFISFLFGLTPLFLRRIVINKLGPLFLTIFDGFFNAIICKAMKTKIESFYQTADTY